MSEPTLEQLTAAANEVRTATQLLNFAVNAARVLGLEVSLNFKDGWRTANDGHLPGYWSAEVTQKL